MNGDTVPHPDLAIRSNSCAKRTRGSSTSPDGPTTFTLCAFAMRLAHCTPAERHAALLHDVVEDTVLTLADLSALGYSDEVIELVDLLTRRKPQGESHRAYLERIVASRIRKRVKLADIYDNMSPARTRSLPPHERGLRHRFARDAERIAAALHELADELAHSIPRGDI